MNIRVPKNLVRALKDLFNDADLDGDKELNHEEIIEMLKHYEKL